MIQALFNELAQDILIRARRRLTYTEGAYSRIGVIKEANEELQELKKAYEGLVEFPKNMTAEELFQLN